MINDPENVFIACFKDEITSEYQWFQFTRDEKWVNYKNISSLEPKDYAELKREFDKLVLFQCLLEFDLKAGTVKTVSMGRSTRFSTMEFQNKDTHVIGPCQRIEYWFEGEPSFNITNIKAGDQIQMGFDIMYNICRVYVYWIKGVAVLLCFLSKESDSTYNPVWYQMCNINYFVWKVCSYTDERLMPKQVSDEMIHLKLKDIFKGINRIFLNVSEPYFNSLSQGKVSFQSHYGTFKFTKVKYKSFPVFKITTESGDVFRVTFYNESEVQHGMDSNLDCSSIHIYFASKFKNQPILMCLEVGFSHVSFEKNYSTSWFCRKINEKITHLWDPVDDLAGIHPEKLESSQLKMLENKLKTLQSSLKSVGKLKRRW